jgi:PAS domain S-box-containing protein
MSNHPLVPAPEESWPPAEPLAALRAMQARFRAAVEAASDILWTNDPSGRMSGPQPGWQAFTGQSLEQCQGHGWTEALHPDDRQPSIAAWQGAVAAGTRFAFEHRVRRHDGVYRSFSVRALPVHDETGRVREWVGVHTDVTDLLEASRAREEAEHRYRQLFQNMTEEVHFWQLVRAPDGAIRTWRLLDANPPALVTWKRQLEDIRGRTADEIFGAGSTEHYRERVEQVFREQRAVTFDDYFPLLDRYFRFTTIPLQDTFITTGSDVTGMRSALATIERQNAELKASEGQFRSLADNIPQLAWMTDASGSIHWYNQRWFEFTGTQLAEMQGWGWKAVHHPGHLARVEAKFREHLASGEPWEDTFPLRSAAGEYRWFLSRAFPLRDADGQIVGWFGTNTDVQEQREAEQALLDAGRRKDEFIATLAHELRNPLAPVRNAVEILARLESADPRIDRVRQIIQRQVTHMGRLIDDLLDVARIARGQLRLALRECELATIVRQVAEDYRGELEKAGCGLEVHAPAQPLWVRGDPVRLAQMLGNYLQNAARFGAGSLVQVGVRAEADRGQAVVWVKDHGTGIAPELLPRLFQSFAQASQGLARTQGGLGLGLALTKGLAELHGGSVSARSEGPGKGATLEFTVPLGPAPVQEPAGGSRSGATARGSVLVVEDNKDAADTLAFLLESEGYAVRVAYDGSAGLAAAREHRPSIVVCDIGLPGLSGYEVAAALRADPAFADALLIALSGYADAEARRAAGTSGFDLHLAKPVEPQVLFQAMQRKDLGAR